MSIRIVLADDHVLFRDALRVLLIAEPDFEVVGEAGNGFDVLRVVEETACEVLLLDVTMPGLSGPHVAEDALRIRHDLAIVVLTMHEEEHYLREFLKSGVSGYVLKQSTGTVLIDAIRVAIRGERYIDPALTDYVIAPYIGDKSTSSNKRASLLTQREQEVCRLVAYGYTNSEMADKLCISERTVETHRANIIAKLDLKSRVELVRFAIDNGLLTVD